MPRLYLSRNLVEFGSLMETKGYRLTHYVDGLEDTIYDRVKDWENQIEGRLKSKRQSLRQEASELINEVHVSTKHEWDGFHCFIGIHESHALLYFVPIESRETPYNKTGWHSFCNDFPVDVVRIHLAFSEEDENRYAVYVNKLTRQFENLRLFLCCNVLTSFQALQVLGYVTALSLGNYRELESDCLEFAKAAAKLAMEQFMTDREIRISKTDLKMEQLDVRELDKLTVTTFKSEALSRRHPSSRYPAMAVFASVKSTAINLILMFLVSLLVVSVYHFLFLRN
jgi:hypothetical protein